MENWSCSDVKAFLITKEFDEELANDLEAKKVDGKVLILIGSGHNVKDLHSILGIQPGMYSFYCEMHT